VSFEADPALAGRLAEEVRRQHMPQCLVMDKALGPRPATAVFEPAPEPVSNSGLGSLSPTVSPGAAGVPVEVATLDEAMRSYGAPRLLVMDIQGGELGALRGGLRVLREARPVVVLEVESPSLARLGGSAKEVHALLEEHGYRCWRFTRLGLRSVKAARGGARRLARGARGTMPRDTRADPGGAGSRGRVPADRFSEPVRAGPDASRRRREQLDKRVRQMVFDSQQPPRPPLAKSAVRLLVPQQVRHRMWTDVVDRPLLSRAYYFLDPEMRDLRLTPRTELLIDGYMRSANTYAVFAFRHANGPTVRLAHHLHRPLVFRRAVALGVPALLTVRPPADVMASMVQFEPESSITGVLDSYRAFYDDLEPVLADLVVADFADVVADFGAVVRRINERFGTSFVPYAKTKDNDHAVFTEVERFSARYFGKDRFETKVSRPSGQRFGAGEFLSRLSDAQRVLLDRATATYEAVVSHA
jgi:FkbM family methyltransferase